VKRDLHGNLGSDGEQLLKYLQAAADHALKNEHGTLKYSITTPRSEPDEGVYVIEE
jgi:hypothetical protein